MSNTTKTTPTAHLTLPELQSDPNALASHYTHFRVHERTLLTGHSHQAWPDCSLDGQRHAWQDAAEYVDDKWAKALAQADLVKAGFRRLLNDPSGHYALGSSTHELLLRFLSAHDFAARPRIVTTDGEFHTIRRQMQRLNEINALDIARVPSADPNKIAELLCGEIDDSTAAVLVSSVLFRNANIVPNLDVVLRKCEKHGTSLLIDAYHHLNVVPFDILEFDLENAFIVGGGYKYCQLGEGNCFLRWPANCTMRPVLTGWYAEFDALEAPPGSDEVQYSTGDGRFAGSTYDPTSHYRAARVFEFFESNNLTPEFLRTVSQHHISLLARTFDALDVQPSIIRRDVDAPLDRIAGFLSLVTPHAESLHQKLRAHNVLTDYRGEYLRLGPAPYLTDTQLTSAVEALNACILDLTL